MKVVVVLAVVAAVIYAAPKEKRFLLDTVDIVDRNNLTKIVCEFLREGAESEGHCERLCAEALAGDSADMVAIRQDCPTICRHFQTTYQILHCSRA